MESSHQTCSNGHQFSCPYFKPCKKHSIRYVVMGRVMQCSQTQLERSPLPGGSGLAGLRRMPPEPQSAAGQQWHHPAAGNRNRNSLKHGNAQLRHETTTLCWKRMNLRIHICCSQNIWNVIILSRSKNRMLANLCMILTAFNIPNKNQLQRTQEVIFQNSKASASLF